jgi:hypothetical protein
MVSGAIAEVVEARGEARHAQDAHRVFAEGVGHVAQHLLAQVALAVVRVGQGLGRWVEAAHRRPHVRQAAAMALTVRSRRARSCSRVTSGAACTVKPR